MVIVHGHQAIHRVTNHELAETLPEEFRYYALNGRTFRTPLLHMHTTASRSSLGWSDGDCPESQLFFSVHHKDDDTAEVDTTLSSRDSSSRRPKRYTECEWCCRMFPFLEAPPKVGSVTLGSLSGWFNVWRTLHAPRQRAHHHGMRQCKLCCNRTSNTRKHVYYCDRNCQDRASQIHRLRHHDCEPQSYERGVILLSWYQAIASALQEVWREQKSAFAAAFILGFLGSCLLPAWSRLVTPAWSPATAAEELWRTLRG